jgi:hypothetical protein
VLRFVRLDDKEAIMITGNEGGSFANLEDDDALFDALASGGEPPQETQEQSEAQSETVEDQQAEEAPAAQQPVAQEQPQETHRVPLRELLDERERRQAAERQFEELRRQFEMVRKQQEEAAKKAQPVPEFWEKPEDSVRHQIQQEISPLREMQAQFEQALAAQREQFSRMQAVSQHGEQAVNDAFSELAKRVQSDPSARYDYQRIMESPHPYGALVEWHKREQAVKEFGSDPNAYREKLSASLLDDPAFLAKALERAQAQARGAQQAPMVTRKSLPSVSKMGAAAPLTSQVDDLDDDALFEKLAAKK